MFKTAFKTGAAALLGLALTAAPALAVEKTAVRVAFSDLDLTTTEGQVQLDRRLTSAARKACGFTGTEAITLAANMQARTCYKQARSKARQAMAVAVDQAADTRLGG